MRTTDNSRCKTLNLPSGNSWRFTILRCNSQSLYVSHSSFFNSTDCTLQTTRERAVDTTDVENNAGCTVFKHPIQWAATNSTTPRPARPAGFQLSTKNSRTEKTSNSNMVLTNHEKLPKSYGLKSFLTVLSFSPIMYWSHLIAFTSTQSLPTGKAPRMYQ